MPKTPTKRTVRPRTMTTMRLDASLLQRLDAAAHKEHRTRANMVETLLDDALTKRGVHAGKEKVADDNSVFG